MYRDIETVAGYRLLVAGYQSLALTGHGFRRAVKNAIPNGFSR
jgi:hypothetical protein